MTFLFGTQSVIAATNPINIQLVPTSGLPATTQIGDTYTMSYTFTNNLPFAKSIHVTATYNDNQFIMDNLCNQVTLAPHGQAGSTCTANIEFQPSKSGSASTQLTLAYDKNVIVLNKLSTTVASICGTSLRIQD